MQLRLRSKNFLHIWMQWMRSHRMRLRSIRVLQTHSLRQTVSIRGLILTGTAFLIHSRLEIESYCSRQPHLPSWTDCGYGYIDEDRTITVHSKSIGIHLHMPMIADGIGVPMENFLRLVQNHGGTFGYKPSLHRQMKLLIGKNFVKIPERPVSWYSISSRTLLLYRKEISCI